MLGRNPLRELLLHSPERIQEVLLGPAFLEPRGKALELFDLIRSHRAPFRQVDIDSLNRLAGDSAHQGCIALVSPRVALTLPQLIDRLPPEGPSLIVAVDDVQDPHNFGAVMRAAECFGADSILYSRNRGSGLTATASKASAGASELIDLCSVSNLADAISKLQDHGFWVVASALDPSAMELSSFTFPDRTLLVLGSEGEGIQPLILKRADHKVYVPMQGRISSLNVSQASSVLLYEYSRQHPGVKPRHRTRHKVV